jgi:histidine triad (HIT) family protein
MQTIVEQIVSKKINASILFESNNVIVFLDHEPISRGHVLVCPKEHYKNISDVPLPILTEIMSVTQKFNKKICDAYNPDGVTILQNNGIFNDLNHFHLHIIPRKKNDGFKWSFKGLGKKTPKELDEIILELK